MRIASLPQEARRRKVSCSRRSRYGFRVSSFVIRDYRILVVHRRLLRRQWRPASGLWGQVCLPNELKLAALCTSVHRCHRLREMLKSTYSVCVSPVALGGPATNVRCEMLDSSKFQV